jgi:tripartite-type tricarboxylate transporter receptor subunit TctC
MTLSKKHTTDHRLRWGMKRLWSLCLFSVGAVLLSSLPRGANAQSTSFPNRPVQLVVASVAGGLPDTVARAIAPKLSADLGQPVVIDNRSGAGGTIAATSVSRASPDGYTIFLTDQAPVAINPTLYRKLAYELQKGFEPISSVGISPLFLVVHPSVKASSLRELIALAQANPGSLSYGSSGVGSLHHLSMEGLKKSQRLDLVHVPYRGTGQAVPAAVSGEIQLMFSALPAAKSFIDSGRLKVLAVNTASRSEQLPGVPTLAEVTGDAGLVYPSELGLLAPARTPASVVARLNAALAAALSDPSTIQRLGALGIQAGSSTPEEYARQLERLSLRFSNLVRAAGLHGSE